VKSALEKVRESPRSTKARILKAAQEVFAQKGFEGASTREIAALAGVNISSLHYHWESKETLYLATFESIYDQIVELVRDSFVKPTSRDDARTMIERTMGLTFDFFAANPTVPKLLMRRMMGGDGVDPAPGQAIMGAAWKTFFDWTREFVGDRLADEDVAFFMLTVQCVLLALLVDSPHVSAMLGGSASPAEHRRRARQQVIRLVETLLGMP
jgi:AcrR family transcriptional regulator